MSAKANKDWSVLGPQLDQLLGLSSPEQERWLGELERQGGASAANASQLRSLLSARDEASRVGFMSGVADPEVLPPTLAQSGDVLGAWALDRLLGEGGMGTVWLARRADGRFEGQAAIKLLRTGLFDRSAQERFKREGGILARLHHPGIAALLDAGVSERGQPYLVLEYVRGQRIDSYCDAADLSVRQRVELFLQVLEAVTAAHTQLIIHRDLKPSNILVDEAGRVRLLDFGLARLQDEEAAVGLTREGGLALTPEYAAPEQFTGAVLTQATDVYALGVVLFELLTGSRPSGLVSVPLLEHLRAIEAAPFALASARASQRERAPVAAHELAGDLDNILAKSLAAAPAERYPSAQSLAADLWRYLDDLPVKARPLGRFELVLKFARRNRTAVAAGMLAVLALILGVVGTSWMAWTASRNAAQAALQRDIALEEKAHAQGVNDLNHFMLQGLPGDKPFTVVEMLMRGATFVNNHPGFSEQLRVELLNHIADLLQLFDQGNLNQKVLLQAFERSRGIANPPARAMAACTLGVTFARKDANFAKARELTRLGLSEVAPHAAFVAQQIECLQAAADVENLAGDAQAAFGHAQAAKQLLVQLKGPSLRIRRETLERVASASRQTGQLAVALQAYQELDQLLHLEGQEQTRSAQTTASNWGYALVMAGRPLEAEQRLSQAQAMGQSLDSNLPLPLLLNRARALTQLEQYKTVLGLCAQIQNVTAGNGLSKTFDAVYLIKARAERELGHQAQAEQLLAQAESKFTANNLPGHYLHAALRVERALLAQQQGNLVEAAGLFEQGLALMRASNNGRPHLPSALLAQGQFFCAQGRALACLGSAQEVLELLAQSLGPDMKSMFRGDALMLQGQALRALGQPRAGRQAQAAAATDFAEAVGAEHDKTLAAKRLAAN